MKVPFGVTSQAMFAGWEAAAFEREVVLGVLRCSGKGVHEVGTVVFTVSA